MSTYLIAIGLIFAIAVFGIAVQRIHAGFARRHGEPGPSRETGGCGACGGGCFGRSCDERDASD